MWLLVERYTSRVTTVVVRLVGPHYFRLKSYLNIYGNIVRSRTLPDGQSDSLTANTAHNNSGIKLETTLTVSHCSLLLYALFWSVRQSSRGTADRSSPLEVRRACEQFRQVPRESLQQD